MTRFRAIGALLILPLAACGQPDEASVEIPNNSDVVVVGSALTTCGWGGLEWARMGYFNMDNRPDVVSPKGGAIFKYEATSSLPYSFSFTQHPVPNTWGSSSFERVADFTGDGRDDIASPDGQTIHMKRSLPNGQFEGTDWPVTISWGAAEFTFSGRFTDDNFMDIASASGGTIRLLKSTGDRFETVPSSVDNLWGSSSFTFAGDFTGDRIADIASASGGNIHMKIGSATGTFTSVTWPVLNQWGGSGYTVAADFDGDGKKDIASASGSYVHMKLARKNGFESKSWPVSNQWGSYWFNSGDFNGDGKADLFSVPSNSSNVVNLKLSTPEGDRFESVTWLLDSVSPFGNVSAIGDFTGDGKTDLATFYSSCAVKVYESTGAGFIPHSS